MRMHQDWRSKIEHTLRTRGRTRLSGDYIQTSLDHFNLLLPKLRLKREVIMHRRVITDLTKGEWSEASIGKFLKYLDKTGAVSTRSAGSRGLGITLNHDLSESPWKSRRSDMGRVVLPAQEVEAPGEPPQEDTEIAIMPTPHPAQHREVPTDEDYSTALDLDLTLSAIDVVSRSLLTIDLDFAKEISGEPAAKVYAAQEKLMLAVKNLAQIRSAIGAGDNSDLEDIVGQSA